MAVRFLFCVFITFSVFTCGLSGRDKQFCEKYDKNGHCTSFEEEEDGPCWIEETKVKNEPATKKLVILDAHEVSKLASKTLLQINLFQD